MAGRLNEHIVCIAVVPQYDGQTRHAFTSDQTHLDRPLAVGHHGDEAALGEVDRVDDLAVPFEKFEDGEVNGLQVLREQLKVCGGKPRQKGVFQRRLKHARPRSEARANRLL
jgi:hypothetical protein